MMIKDNADFKIPFFSVIVPVYNAQVFLHEAVDSVLAQAFADFEILLVDDGSTDSSPEICDKYAAADPRITAYHKKNEGQLATRVYGMKKAHGRYIVTLDADDKLRFDALEIIYRTIDEYDSDMVIFNFSQVEDFSEKGRKIALPERRILKKEEIYEQVLGGQTLNNIWMKVFRREYADVSDNILEYSYIKFEEDLIQSLQPLTQCGRPVFIDENLYFYRPNPESITRRFQQDCFKWTRDTGEVLYKCIDIWKLEPEKWTKLLYKRDFELCITNIKYYIRNCPDFADTKSYLDQIRNDAFFKDSYKSTDLKNFGIKKSLWAVFLKKRWYALLKLYMKAINMKSRFV